MVGRSVMKGGGWLHRASQASPTSRMTETWSGNSSFTIGESGRPSTGVVSDCEGGKKWVPVNDVEEIGLALGRDGCRVRKGWS